MSSRSCLDWPRLMEVASELQFKHYTVREAALPSGVLLELDTTRLELVTICCDLDHHVFNPNQTDRDLAEALRASHWLALHE